MYLLLSESCADTYMQNRSLCLLPALGELPLLFHHFPSPSATRHLPPFLTLADVWTERLIAMMLPRQ